MLDGSRRGRAGTTLSPERGSTPAASVAGVRQESWSRPALVDLRIVCIYITMTYSMPARPSGGTALANRTAGAANTFHPEPGSEREPAGNAHRDLGQPVSPAHRDVRLRVGALARDRRPSGRGHCRSPGGRAGSGGADYPATVLGPVDGSRRQAAAHAVASGAGRRRAPRGRGSRRLIHVYVRRMPRALDSFRDPAQRLRARALRSRRSAVVAGRRCGASALRRLLSRVRCDPALAGAAARLRRADCVSDGGAHQ